MLLEKFTKDISKIIHIVWPKEEKYIPLGVLHTRILLAMGYKPQKQKNWRFCRLLKAAIKANIECKEIRLDGYNKYKRL